MARAVTSSGAAQGSGKKGLLVGIEVLIGLLGFFGPCFVLFGACFAYMKRQWVRGAAIATMTAGGPTGSAKDGPYSLTAPEYFPAPCKSHSSSEPSKRAPPETLRGAHPDVEADEFGALKRASGGSLERDPWADALGDSRPPPLLPSPVFDEFVFAMPEPPPTASKKPSGNRIQTNHYNVDGEYMHRNNPGRLDIPPRTATRRPDCVSQIDSEGKKIGSCSQLG
ncbi:hypothetical protein C8Q78DRAFT_1083660 [Trametes maxima]|nr:hypothetical protein C8Q78DRAFT_1083660 [Trametes maxima]